MGRDKRMHPNRHALETARRALTLKITFCLLFSGPEPGVLACITLFGHAIPDLVQEDIRALLDAILATGLSPSLTIALRELATSVPVLKRDISQGLLKMLSQVLMHEPLRHPGTPRHAIINPSPPQVRQRENHRKY